MILKFPHTEISLKLKEDMVFFGLVIHVLLKRLKWNTWLSSYTSVYHFFRTTIVRRLMAQWKVCKLILKAPNWCSVKTLWISFTHTVTYLVFYQGLIYSLWESWESSILYTHMHTHVDRLPTFVICIPRSLHYSLFLRVTGCHELNLVFD